MIRALFVALLVPTVIASNLAFAQREDMLTGLERYAPEQAVAGTIRIEGNNYAKGLVNLWQEGFHKFHPSVRFETSLKGSETGIAALYVGAADITFLGREIYRSEEAAFVERFGYPPLGFDTTTGSYDRPHMTFALMVFVHASNPLSRVSLSQVERVFRCMEGGAAIRTWGELGLKDEEWKNRPIHIYSYGADSGFARFLQSEIFKSSVTWRSEMLEFYNVKQSGGREIDSGKLILDALASDPYGIAFSNITYINRRVKPLAVAPRGDGTSFEPTKENVWKRAYPITRFTTAFLNRQPGKPVDPKLTEFVRYILSRDGQEAVLRDGSYLPLTGELIRHQLRKFE